MSFPFFYSCSDSQSNRSVCSFHPLRSFQAASRLSEVMRVGPKASASIRDASDPPRPISKSLGCTILSRAVRFCTIILPASGLMIMPPLEISRCLFGVPLSRMSPQRHFHVILSATSINYSQVSVWWAVGKRQFLDLVNFGCFNSSKFFYRMQLKEDIVFHLVIECVSPYASFLHWSIYL